MSTASLSTLDKFCFKCRRDTEHVFVGVVGGKQIYQCTVPCGAAPREITAREDMTNIPRDPAPATPPVKKAHWLTPERRFAVLESRIKKTPKEIKTMPKSNDAPPLRAAIWDIVGERLQEIPPSLTREDVAEIVREQINAALGVDVSVKKASKTATASADGRCPRGDHKYACPSKKCIEAGYK